MLPNLMLGVNPGYLFVFGVQPTAPDRTLELFHLYFVGDGGLADRSLMRRLLRLLHLSVMCIIDPEWMEKIGGPGEEERDTLDLAFDMMETLRLSCQIPFTAELDRLRMKLGAE